MLDGIISMGLLCDFLDEFFTIIAEEKAWEFWLHKNTGRSWEDFKLACIPQDADEEAITDTISEIEDALSGGEYSYGSI
jgi:hypothetical protein